MLTTDSDARSLPRAGLSRTEVQQGLADAGQLGDLGRPLTDDNERDPFTIRYADYLDLASEHSLSDRHSRHRVNIFSRSTCRRAFRSARWCSTLAQPDDGQRPHRTGPEPTVRPTIAAVNGLTSAATAGEGQRVLHAGPARRRSSCCRAANGRGAVRGVQLTNSDNNIVSQISGGLLFDFSARLQRHRRSATGADRRPLPLCVG